MQEITSNQFFQYGAITAKCGKYKLDVSVISKLWWNADNVDALLPGPAAAAQYYKVVSTPG